MKRRRLTRMLRPLTSEGHYMREPFEAVLDRIPDLPVATVKAEPLFEIVSELGGGEPDPGDGPLGDPAKLVTTCTEECRAQPDCVKCGRPKAPRGRSIAPAMAGGLCDTDCPGYDQAPQAGHLWPNEDLPTLLG